MLSMHVYMLKNLTYARAFHTTMFSAVGGYSSCGLNCTYIHDTGMFYEECTNSLIKGARNALLKRDLDKESETSCSTSQLFGAVISL